MRKLMRIIMLMLVVMIPLQVHGASDSFNFDGVLTNGGSPITGSKQILFQIFNPAATCLLYEEMQTVALPADGSFSVKVGSALGAPQRSAGDPGLSMTAVFQNKSAVTGYSSCSYTPNPADIRKMRVTVDPLGTPVVLAPDYEMAAAPMAKVAESVDGYKASDLLHVNASANLDQPNLESIFNAGNFAKLTSLLSGNSPTALNMGGNAVTNVAAPSAGTDAVNKSYADAKVAGSNVNLTGLAAGKVMSWDGSQWVVTAPSSTDATKLPLAGGTMTGAINMSGQNIQATGHITMSPQMAINLGTFTNAQEGVLVGTLLPANKGAFWYNTDVLALKVWNGTTVDTVSSAGGGITSLNGQTAGTQTFAFDSTGTDFNINSSAGVHTFQLPSASPTNRGLLTSADWSSFNAKLSAAAAFGGDVSGAYNAISVNKLRGVNIDPTAPTSGYVLKYNGTDWAPAAESAGGMNQLTGDVTAGPGSGSQVATISNNAITLTKLAANSVDSARIVDGSINTQDIANVSYDRFVNIGGNYMNYMPNNVECADGEILVWQAATDRWVCGAAGAGTVTSITTGTGLAGGPITSSGTISIAANGVGSAELAPNSVNTSKIMDGTIVAADLGANTIDSSKIADGTIINADISDVSYNKFVNSAGGFMNYMPNNTACANGEVLVWQSGPDRWICGAAGSGNFMADGSVAMTGNLRMSSTWLSGDGGNEGVFVANSGNVGIGTTTPNELLSVEGAVSLKEMTAPGSTANYGKLYVKSSDSKLYFMNDSGVETDLLSGGGGGDFMANGSVPMSGSLRLIDGGAGSPAVAFTSDASTGFYKMAPGAIGISSSGTNIFSLDSVGLMSPTTGGARVATSNGTAGNPTYSFAGDSDVGMYRPAANILAFSTNSVERMQINGNGEVGIGTSPSIGYILDVRSGASDGRMSLGTITGGYNSELELYTATRGLKFYLDNTTGRFGLFDVIGAAERWTVTNNGNVGIGITSPNTKLEVSGAIRVGNNGETCSGSTSGAIRYNGSLIEFCNGSSWAAINGGLGAGSVGTAEIANETIQSNDIQDGTISASDLAANSVNNSKIVDMSIDKLVNGAGLYFNYMPNNTECGNGEILNWNGTLDRWECTPNAGAVAINSLTGDVTASGPGVATATIANNAITSAKIAVDTITAADIAANAVGTSEILDGTIIGADIAAGTITPSHLSGALAASNMASGTLISGAPNYLASAVTVGTNNANSFDIATNAVARMTVAPNGNVGIAVNDPTSFLSLPSTIKALEISGDGSASTNAAGALVLSNNRSAASATDTTGSIKFASRANSGTPMPTSQINGGLEGGGGANGYGGFLSFFVKPNNVSSSNEVMRINSAGNVGIGTNAPGTTLEVSKSANPTFGMSDLGVAHGIGLAPTNMFFYVAPVGGGSGGAGINGFTDDTATSAVVISGNLGSPTPNTNVAAVALNARKKNGAGTQPLGGMDTVLNIQNDSSNLVSVLGSGAVGIGTTSPMSRLDVMGDIRAESISTPSQPLGAVSSIDWSMGNSATTSYACGANFTFNNLREGGSYILVVTDTGTTTCNFSTSLSGIDGGTVTYRFKPANSTRTASSHTIYKLTRVGNIVYVDWNSGY